MISHRNYWTVTVRQISKRGCDRASIIENLITELNDEYALYEQLLQVSMEKTGAIVSNNLDRLSETTEKEQRLADALASVEHRRRETMTNVANILGKRPDDVKVMDVVTFLEGQPEFHDPLLSINEKLAKLARKVREVNGHNQNLIQDALEMIEYNINLMQNLNRAPETAEYSKEMFKGNAAYAGGADVPGRFDVQN